MSTMADVEKRHSPDSGLHEKRDHDDHTGPLAHPISNLTARAVDSFGSLPAGLQARIDFRLIPVLAFMYGMSLIDRTDLPAARLSGLDAAPIFMGVGDRYSVTALVFFPTYILAEIPANYFFKRSGINPRWWLPTWTMCFAAIKVASSAAPDWNTVAGLRAVLGIFEGALFPGCVYLISCWYPRHELAKRIAAFYLGGALIGGFGNAIAYGWSTMAGMQGKAGWQWIFIMMGVLTFISGLIGYIAVPNFPHYTSERGTHHISAEEKELVLRRIEIDRHDVVQETLTVKETFHYLGNPRIWIYGLLFCLSTLPTYAFAYFLPLILRGALGYSIKDAQVLSAPPYIVACAWGGIMSFLSDRIKMRGPFVIFCALLALIGSAVIGYATNVQARYAAAYLALMGCQSNISMIVAWSSNNVRTQNGRAINSAVVVAGGGIGGIIASVAFRTQDAPQYIPGLLTVIVAQVVIVFVSLALMAFYSVRNKQADEGKRTLEGHEKYRFTL